MRKADAIRTGVMPWQGVSSGIPGEKLYARPTKKLPQYPAHRVLAPMTSGEKATGERRSNLRRSMGRHDQMDLETERSKRRAASLFIASYNARTLSSECDLEAFLYATQDLRYDIIALQETKRRNQFTQQRTNGPLIILGEKVAGKNVGGVGFLVNPTIVPFVDSYEVISPRLAILRLTFPRQESMTLLNVYAPTSCSTEEDREEFFGSLEEIMAKEKAFYRIVLGDFNSRIGPDSQSPRIGNFTSEQWNENGHRFVEMLSTTRIFHMNSRFQKNPNKRWTWKSPNGSTKSEIDHFCCNRPWCVEDVHVVPSFSGGSDHRLLRARVLLKRKLSKKIKHTKPLANVIQELNSEAFLDASEGYDWSRAIDDYDQLISGILECAEKSYTKKNKPKKLSEKSLYWLRRRKPILESSESTELEKAMVQLSCRVFVKRDIETYRQTKLLQAAENRKSIKKCRRDLTEGRVPMEALVDEDGNRTTSRLKMEEITKKFYTELFKSSITVDIPNNIPNEDDIKEVLPSEVRVAIQSLKSGTAPGNDKISADMLKAAGPRLISVLSKIYTKCLETGKIPKDWKNSKTILLHKKGNREDLKNYRPICLLSIIYKVFTKIILNRITRQLDEAQPIEQAGFRAGFSCIDHIHSVTQVIERCREYKMPLVLTFIDYEKAFDNVEHNAVIKALQEQGINSTYLRVLKECYTDTSTTIQLFDRKIEIPIGKGVRQGDTISPKLFSAALQSTMKNLDWSTQGINIDGKRLSHLRFADDIVLITTTIQEAEDMLHELNNCSMSIGLKINRRKTQFMKNKHVPDRELCLGTEKLEEVQSYVYLGRSINMQNDTRQEVTRRRMAAWAAYNNIKSFAHQVSDNRKRAQLFDSAILPALCYASETWASTKGTLNHVRTTHRALERSLMQVSKHQQRRLKISSSSIREKSLVEDPQVRIIKGKMRWAGHIARRQDDRWTTRCTEWYPRGVKRPLGRPPTRWSDSVSLNWKSYSNENNDRRRRLPHWLTAARDRLTWRSVGTHALKNAEE